MKHLLSLNEFRNQLEIPFFDKHPLHGKPTHVHIIDALEDMANELKIKPEDYKSDWDTDSIVDAWNFKKKGAFREYQEHILYSIDNITDINYEFLNDYDVKTNVQDYINETDITYFSEEIVDYVRANPDCSTQDITEEFDLFNELRNYLSEDGFEIWKNESMEKTFDNKTDDFYALGTIKDEQTEEGLIPIYRAISYTKDEFVDTYHKIRSFDAVGIFWSYEESGAEPHNGGVDNCFVLYGLVKPEYINWESTIYKSAYELNEEREIELNHDVPVLIYKIKEYRSKIEVKMRTPLVVKA
jgi:hypothetical protein